jgi:cold shock protein
VLQGTVKFFNAEKGFGFISREGGDASDRADVLGLGALPAEFEIGNGRKGPEAQNVRPI